MARPTQPLFLARSSYRQRRLRDAARLLPLAAALLWLLPLLWARGPDGVSTATVLLYLFGVWIALILATFVLSRLIGPDTDPTGDEDGP
jgi:hypothetical protein